MPKCRRFAGQKKELTFLNPKTFQVFNGCEKIATNTKFLFGLLVILIFFSGCIGNYRGEINQITEFHE